MRITRVLGIPAPTKVSEDIIMLPVHRPLLVVADDPDILDTIAQVLDLEGYTIERATNGAEALQVVDQTRPALVLLDMRMPILDGWGFARELRERGIQIPIVVMTAARDARAWAREIGADGCLAKPFELLDLISTVQQLRPV